MRKIVSDFCAFDFCKSERDRYRQLANSTLNYNDKMEFLRLEDYYDRLAGYHYLKMEKEGKRKC